MMEANVVDVVEVGSSAALPEASPGWGFLQRKQRKTKDSPVPAFSFTGEKANQNDFEKKVTGKWPLANFGERLMAVCKFDHDTVHGSKNSNINMKCLMCGSWE